MGAFYTEVEAFGQPKGTKIAITLPRLGRYEDSLRHRSFLSALSSALPWTDISTNPGYQDFWQVWNGRVILEHLSQLRDEFPGESDEFKVWLESFGEKLKIVTISEHEWESGLDT